MFKSAYKIPQFGWSFVWSLKMVGAVCQLDVKNVSLHGHINPAATQVRGLGEDICMVPLQSSQQSKAIPFERPTSLRAFCHVVCYSKEQPSCSRCLSKRLQFCLGWRLMYIILAKFPVDLNYLLIKKPNADQFSTSSLINWKFPNLFRSISFLLLPV